MTDLWQIYQIHLRSIVFLKLSIPFAHFFYNICKHEAIFNQNLLEFMDDLGSNTGQDGWMFLLQDSDARLTGWLMLVAALKHSVLLDGTVFICFIVSSCPCASLGLFICTLRAKTRRCFSMATGRHVLVAVAKIQRHYGPMGLHTRTIPKLQNHQKKVCHSISIRLW